MKRILVIDGQGGGFGKSIIEKLKQNKPNNCEIIGIGTNSIATSVMLKAGADMVATGENPVIVGCKKADVIAGPMGIVLANSMLGEFSPAMAAAVAESEAIRVLIPVSRCNTHIAGVVEKPLSKYIDDAVAMIVAHVNDSNVS